MALTDLEAFRLELGDVDVADFQFTDEEAEYFLANHSGNVLLAVADACDALARRYARLGDTTIKSADDSVTRKASHIAKGYADLAKDLRARSTAPSGGPWHGTSSIARKNTLRDDVDRVQPRVSRGEFDAPGTAA